MRFPSLDTCCSRAMIVLLLCQGGRNDVCGDNKSVVYKCVWPIAPSSFEALYKGCGHADVAFLERMILLWLRDKPRDDKMTRVPWRRLFRRLTVASRRHSETNVSLSQFVVRCIAFTIVSTDRYCRAHRLLITAL